MRTERTEELSELMRTVQMHQGLATGPASALSWDLDEDSLVTTTIEQLRGGDTIPLKLLLRRASGEAARLVDEEQSHNDVALLLDRVACVAVTCLQVEEKLLFRRAIGVLEDIYNLGFDGRGMTKTLQIGAARLWLLVIERVMAIGAVLVQEEEWDLARELALQRGSGYDFTDGRFFYVTWIRHATTEASRAGLYIEDVDGKRVDRSLLWLVLKLVEESDCFRLGLGSDDERILNHICQFDVFAMLAALDAAGSCDTHHYYPHFARFFEHRSLPMLNRVVSDPAVRKAAFSHLSDRRLAAAIRWMNETAVQEGFRFSGWDGSLSPQVRKFLEEHPSET